jgi:hypothetical protein
VSIPTQGKGGVITQPHAGGVLLTPGTFVVHPAYPDWGLGQVQSVDGSRVTVNFENSGKQLINSNVVMLRTVDPDKYS